MNRLKDYFGDPLEPERKDDFFEIECRYDSFAVSQQTAVEIEERLDQRPPPRWIAFRDLSGATSDSRGSHHADLREHG